MKNKYLLYCLVFTLMLNLSESWAQERNITGKVTSIDDGSPVPGMNVIVKGTATGTITDADGVYTLTVGNDTTLIFSFIGYVSQEIAVGNRSVIDLQMVTDVRQLSEIVVTALGVQREKKALGYSVQEVKGDELAQSKETNIVNSLAGRVAGLTVNSSSGAPGASSRIVIRGNSSLKGNNQPLFVVDGIPIDNTQFSSSAGNDTNEPSNGTRKGDLEGGAADYGNAAQDIDSNSIESLTVLKGPTAVALYGSRAQNGAIIITTKSGKGQKGVVVNFSTSYSQQTPLRLPDFQNEYGQGGGGSVDYPEYLDVDESWGDRLDQGTTKKDIFNKEVPWVSRPDNIKDFFETGHNFANSISLQGSSDVGNFRFSISDVEQTGIMPNTGFNKKNFSTNSGMKLTDKLRVDVSLNYSIIEGKNRPNAGYDGQNALQTLFNWSGRQIDYNQFKNYKDKDGNLILNTSDPDNGASFGKPIAPIPAWQNNPWAIYNENVNNDRRDRVIGNFKIGYDVTDWLNASIRAGTDFYEDTRTQKYKAGLQADPPLVNGGFVNDNYTVNTYNIDFVLSATKELNENISSSLILGANRYHNTISNEFTRVQGLLVADIYNLSNAGGTPEVSNYLAEKEINGLYFAGQLSYKNILFVDFTGRNDWSSTLPESSNSYFYPSVSTSFILSDAFDIPFFSFAKIRGGIARVGNDAGVYETESFFVGKRISNSQADIVFPFNGGASFTLGDQLANPDLKPEKTTSWEVGADLRFFGRRLIFDITYYSAKTLNQLLDLTLPSSSGFGSQFINAGEVKNSGFELSVTGTPIQTSSGFSWDMLVNFSKNNNEVVKLHPHVESLLLERHRAQTEARAGRPYGEIYGTAWARKEGRRLIGANGLPSRASGGNQLLGNITPDFTMGISSTFSYKSISLSALIDWKQGGDIFSLTEFFGGYSGVLAKTLPNRENKDYIAEGVLESGEENTIEVDPEKYWHRTFSAQEEGVFDASYIKLREVRISYEFPQSLITKTPFNSVNFSLIGRNLAILHSNVDNIDPESSAYGASNGQGFEVNGIPSVKSYGANLSISF